MVFWSKPALGGSTIVTSKFCFKLFTNFDVSPQIKSILSILFNFLFFSASKMAYLLISIPITFLQYLLKYIPILPVPQYKSKTLSFCFKLAYSNTLLYKQIAPAVFTWKKESGEITKLNSFNFSII